MMKRLTLKNLHHIITEIYDDLCAEMRAQAQAQAAAAAPEEEGPNSLRAGNPVDAAADEAAAAAGARVRRRGG